MEMKDNEIINVIEAMLENYYGSKCQLVETLRLSFDLINRQQAEIEKWKKAATKEFTCFVGDPHRVESCPYLDELEKANAEIGQLRELVIEGGREQDRLMAEIERLQNELARECQGTIKFRNNTIKEFAERFKGVYDGFDEQTEEIHFKNLICTIDNLVKEMTDFKGVRI